MEEVKIKNKLGINEFYDINKLPVSYWITVLWISMPLIEFKQSAKNCFDSTKFIISKIKKSSVGAVIVYSDWLYMNSDDSAFELKSKFQLLMENHKQKYSKLISKDKNIIPSAFSFVTWGQLILSCNDFTKYLRQLKEYYLKDELFKKYVEMDIVWNNKTVNKNTVNYILEECLLDYLVAMGKVRLQNDYVQDKETWILNCYHWKPHRSHVYIYQKNFFNFKSTNIYKWSWYDLMNKKLYDFDRLDIESFDFY